MNLFVEIASFGKLTPDIESWDRAENSMISFKAVIKTQIFNFLIIIHLLYTLLKNWGKRRGTSFYRRNLFQNIFPIILGTSSKILQYNRIENLEPLPEVFSTRTNYF